MKKWKQALALVLALVMALSLMALPSFAEGEETGGAESTQPEWPNEGAIQLNKEAKPVQGKDGVYEITLTIEGKNYKTTSDVVLVIDKSGSMNDDDKLRDTKKAAIAFGEKLLTKGSTTRIAIVTYADNATSINKGHFYTADELDAFKSQINGITASGGTNQQAGIHKAQELLAASTGKQKNIVILSDGEPTYSYRLTGTAGWTGCYIDWRGVHQWGDWVSGGKVDSSTISVTGCSYELVGTGYAKTSGKYEPGEINLAITCEHGKSRTVNSYSLDHSVATIWEANQAKAAGTTIFSVALQAGTDGENTLKSCATDAAKGYFAIGQNDNVETKLTAAFEAIAGSIAIAAKNGTVIDPMSDYVSLNFEGTPTVTSDETAYNDGRADVYLSQGTVTRNEQTLSWDVGNINEGTPAVMKYRVTLRGDVGKGQTYPTNKTTTFTYTDYQDESATKDFPIPQVTLNGGTIRKHFYLVNDQGQPINRDGVVVESPDKAAELTPEEYFLNDEGTKALNYGAYQVERKDISGYTYYGYTLNGRDKTDSGVESTDEVAPVDITITNANREVWFAYYQTFNVVHVRMDENGNAKTVGTDTYPVSQSFNLTDKVNKDKDGNAVTEGTYLYGGAFNDPACTEAYPFANEGETGLSFAPKAGATYYIWEVPNAYLIPKALVGWEHNQDNKLDVIAFYMMAGIDREYYAGVGFTVNGKDNLSNQNTLIDYSTGDNQGKTKVVSLPQGQSSGFQSVELKRKDGNTQTYTVMNVVPGYDKGFIACYGLAQADWKNTDVTTTYTPYWITLDGVKVTSGVTRTATYQGVGYQRLKTEDTGDAGNPVYAKNTQTATRLMTFASYLADSTPIAQETPTVENVTVTVRDSNKTTQVEIPCGTSARDQISYQAPAGKVFAGWFTDEACTTPANLDSITQDTTIYAKYVSDSYLDLHYVRNGLFRLRGVTLISAVDDPANYQESGIIVDGEKLPVAYAARYRLFYTASGLFGAARNAKLMITQQSLSGSGTLEVTPYWVTKDGTTVLGENHTLHYNTRTIWK